MNRILVCIYLICNELSLFLYTLGRLYTFRKMATQGFAHLRIRLLFSLLLSQVLDVFVSAHVRFSLKKARAIVHWLEEGMLNQAQVHALQHLSRQ